jgi:hypothetical protein
MQLYLTDFLNRVFVAEIAKYRGFCAGNIINPRRVYRANINYIPALRKYVPPVAGMGGPLGKTKRVSAGGIVDVSNGLGAFTVVSAESHEAAAKLFENHPHFTIFPGEPVEVMPVLPIPGVQPAAKLAQVLTELPAVPATVRGNLQ